MWVKAVGGAAVLAAGMWCGATGTAHADGACTALGNNPTTATTAFNQCVAQNHVTCVRTGGFALDAQVTCTYPDGGRDDCHGHFAPMTAVPDSASCTYIPPGH